jgi:drug/metabolite transporter (DMT)-like permease
MNTSVRRLRGAVLMGLAWAIVWGPAAVLIGLMVDPDGSMDEMWVAIGAIPGFLGGVAFSIVLALAAGRRHLEELSTARVAGWGALGGVLALPLLAAVVIGTIALLSAASAAASLALARKPARPDRLGGGVDVLRVSRSAAPARELPGRTPGARRDA